MRTHTQTQTQIVRRQDPNILILRRGPCLGLPSSSPFFSVVVFLLLLSSLLKLYFSNYIFLLLNQTITLSMSRLYSAWLATSSSSCFSVFFASSLATISVSSVFTFSSSGTGFGLPLTSRTKGA